MEGRDVVQASEHVSSDIMSRLLEAMENGSWSESRLEKEFYLSREKET